MSESISRRVHFAEIGIWLCLAASAAGQIRSDFVTIANHATSFDTVVVRWNDRLEILSATNVDVEGDGGSDARLHMSMDSLGIRGLAWDMLHSTKLVRIASDGSLLPSAVIGHNPVSVVTGVGDVRFMMTRVPLQSPGPVYAISPSGAVLWSSWKAFFSIGCYGCVGSSSAVTPNGNLWLAGVDAGPCLCQLFPTQLQLAMIDPTNGLPLVKFHLPMMT